MRGGPLCSPWSPLVTATASYVVQERAGVMMGVCKAALTSAQLQCDVGVGTAPMTSA